MSGRVASCSFRHSLSLKLRIGAIGLIAALALTGCTEAGTSPTGAASSLGTASNPGSASATASPGQLQPPAAPSALHEWVDLTSARTVPAYFEWTAPTGSISGYYFWTKGVYVDMTPPPAVCGPTWEKIPAADTTHMMASVQAEPQAYICAYNDAGTSSTVEFSQDTPWVPSQPTRPGPPDALDSYLDPSEGGTYPAEVLDWVAPLQPVSGFYLDIWHGGGDIPAPTACDPSWTKLAASARTYRIAAVEELPSVLICAFNDAGISPMVQFPTPARV
jgi:hypothetical protein